MQPEVSHERAQPLGINVRVARDCCDALVAEESIKDWVQRCSSAQRVGGNRGHAFVDGGRASWGHLWS